MNAYQINIGARSADEGDGLPAFDPDKHSESNWPSVAALDRVLSVRQELEVQRLREAGGW